MEYKRVITNDTEYDFDRVFLRVHGFRDCPVSVIDLDHSLEQKMRTNEENFLSICYQFRSDSYGSSIFYKDFDKFFHLTENK